MSDDENGGADSPVFQTHAPLYWAKGLSVIPLEPKSKRPAQEISGWSGYCNQPPHPDKQREWLARYPDRNIGLLTGSEIGNGERLGAIDVDQDEFVRVTEVVLCWK